MTDEICEKKTAKEAYSDWKMKHSPHAYSSSGASRVEVADAAPDGGGDPNAVM